MKENWGPVLSLERNGTPKTQADEVFFRVREDVISGDLHPGTRLKLNELKTRYEIGASPLREALFQLSAEGLVRVEGQKGFRTTELSLQELDDVTRLRSEFESKALQQSIEKGDIEWEVQVTATYRRLLNAEKGTADNSRGFQRQWEDTHRAFHFAMYGACGSPWLLYFCERLINQSERYRRNFLHYDKIPGLIGRQHEMLFDECMARNANKACRILTEHILLAAETTRKAFVKAHRKSS